MIYLLCIMTEFKFREYEDLPNKPVDVYEGTIYLGTIQITSDGRSYEIKLIKHPHTGMNVSIKSGSNNLFKTRIDAANTLSKVWKHMKLR